MSFASRKASPAVSRASGGRQPVATGESERDRKWRQRQQHRLAEREAVRSPMSLRDEVLARKAGSKQGSPEPSMRGPIMPRHQLADLGQGSSMEHLSSPTSPKVAHYAPVGIDLDDPTVKAPTAVPGLDVAPTISSARLAPSPRSAEARHGQKIQHGRRAGASHRQEQVHSDSASVAPSVARSEVSTKSKYMQELEAQMEENRRRKELEKQAELQEEQRAQKEAEEYNYFARRASHGNESQGRDHHSISQAGRDVVADYGRNERQPPQASPAPPSTAGSRKVMDQASYRAELQQQIEEQRRRKEKAKREEEAESQKPESEGGFWAYFGTPGGGAPMRTTHGSIVADLREVLPAASIDGTPSKRSVGRGSASISGRQSVGSAVHHDHYDQHESPSTLTYDMDQYVSDSGNRRIVNSASLPTDPAFAYDSEKRQLKEENLRLKKEVLDLEEKLLRASDLLQAYRERFGPL